VAAPQLTFIVVLTELCPTVTAAGSKLQLMPAGKPVQKRLTVLLKPPCGVICTVIGELCPGCSSTEELLSERVSVPADVGVGVGVGAALIVRCSGEELLAL
jgi:hypothetical protein